MASPGKGSRPFSRSSPRKERKKKKEEKIAKLSQSPEREQRNWNPLRGKFRSKRKKKKRRAGTQIFLSPRPRPRVFIKRCQHSRSNRMWINSVLFLIVEKECSYAVKYATRQGPTTSSDSLRSRSWPVIVCPNYTYFFLLVLEIRFCSTISRNFDTPSSRKSSTNFPSLLFHRFTVVPGALVDSSRS